MEKTTMSLQKYTALLKTVELGSISRAAEEMGYTQSAVSRMIADLEDQWGLATLRRSRAGGGYVPGRLAGKAPGLYRL